MTRYCSKKVVVLCLCVTTILASVFIGRNIYQGTPTYQNIVGSKSLSSGTDETHKYTGTSQIGNRLNHLNLTLVRQGGLSQKNKHVVAESVWEEEDEKEEAGKNENENDSSESADNPNFSRVVEDVQRPAPPGGNKVGSKQGANREIGATFIKSQNVLMTDPRMPRLLRKLLEKLPVKVREDIPQEYRRFQFKNDRNHFLKQWQVVTETAAKHGLRQRLPDVINIGVKKSGTNAMGFFVTQHPQIAHSLGNEVHFFDRNYEKGLEYYRLRMGFAKDDQLSFEKTPKYFVTKGAPAQILKDLPKHIKFILCVRDPVKRALSDFRHESELALRRQAKTRLRNRRLERTSPEEQGKIFEKQVLDKNGNVNASNVIIDTSYYAKHYKHWLEYFPPDRFMVVNLDTLEKDAFPKLKEIEEFLGLDPYFKEEMFYYDESRHGTCMHGKMRPCPAKSTPGVLPKAKPSDATLKKLYDFYRPSNKELMELTGQDFEWAHL